jgi:hypothetical protein
MEDWGILTFEELITKHEVFICIPKAISVFSPGPYYIGTYRDNYLGGNSFI